MNAMPLSAGDILQRLRADPGRVARRALGWARARVLLRGCDVGDAVLALGALRVEARGAVRIGARTTFMGGMLPTEIVCHPGARLELGEACMLNYGASIEAHGAIRIGARCMIASYVRLCARGRDGVAPVTLGDDVWLAHGVVVEPGVTIGAGASVSAGSVVTRDVPPGALAVGNPARCIALPPADVVVR
jgi:acetyltransferase-like isoleucine patch superfamily enzyme